MCMEMLTMLLVTPQSPHVIMCSLSKDRLAPAHQLGCDSKHYLQIHVTPTCLESCHTTCVKALDTWATGYAALHVIWHISF